MKRGLRIERLEERRVLATAIASADLMQGFGLASTEGASAYEGVMVAEGEAGDAVSSYEFVAVLHVVPLPDGVLGIGGPEGGAPTGEGESNDGDRFDAGVARFLADSASDTMRYTFQLPRLAGGASAVIRLGNPETGPTAAVLFDVTIPDDTTSEVTGTLTDNDIMPIDELGFGGTVTELVNAMRGGQAHIEVATKDGPALRGTTQPSMIRPLHNPLNRMDVVADGTVSPRDVLAVINDLDENGARAVSPLSDNVLLSNVTFVDVSGDNFLSPRDALAVIDFLGSVDNVTGVAGPASQAEAELLGLLELSPADYPDFDFRSAWDGLSISDADSLEQLLDQMAGSLQTHYERYYAVKIGDGEMLDKVHVNWDELRGQHEVDDQEDATGFSNVGPIL